MSSEDNRVLIAEDHYVSRHLLERNLMNWGFSVVTAEDGEAALAILESDDAPPLAIVDWMMPKMDGLEVCARVRQHSNRPYVYLVLLTAKSQKEEIAAGLQAGADDYVIKPFDPDELRARLTVGQRVVELERALARKVARSGGGAGGRAEAADAFAHLHVLQERSRRPGLLAPDRRVHPPGDGH